MKYTEIEKIYTAKVSELIARGFQISTETMKYTDGTTHIDFTNGSEIRRLQLRDDISKGAKYAWQGVPTKVLTISTIPYEQRNRSYPDETTVFEIEWGTIFPCGWDKSREWFGNVTEAKEAERKRTKRYYAKETRSEIDIGLSPKAVSAVLKRINQIYGFKSAKPSDVTSIRRRVVPGGHLEYYVTCKSREFILVPGRTERN